MGPPVDGPATGVLDDKEGLPGVEEEGSGFWDVTGGIWGLSPVCGACCLPLRNFLDGRESEVIDDSAGVTKVYYGRVWLPYLIVESLSSRLQGVTHRKASCISEAKHVPLYTPKVSMVMIVIYLWCHWYVIQYWDHVFHHMHVSDMLKDVCPRHACDVITWRIICFRYCLYTDDAVYRLDYYDYHI